MFQRFQNKKAAAQAEQPTGSRPESSHSEAGRVTEIRDELHQEPKRKRPGAEQDLALLEAMARLSQKAEKASTPVRSETQVLLDFAKRGKLFRQPDDEPFIVFDAPIGRLTFEVRSEEGARFLSGLYQNQHKKAPQRQAIREALRELEIQASYGENVETLHLRRARTPEGIWLDLGDAQGRVAQISPQGWRIVAHAPVYFKRPRHQLPLPAPELGGDRTLLEGMLTVTDRMDLMLLLGWIMAAYNPLIPAPMLVFTGPQGSGKTTLARLLRMLIDPSRAEVMGLPGEAVFAQVLEHHAVPVFDNLGRLTARQANLLCRGVTGLSYIKRRHFTDSEDVILGARRPMILTALETPTEAPDWLDRALVLKLPLLTGRVRAEETQLMHVFLSHQAKFLGLMMTGLSATMTETARMPRTMNLPRMADFAAWGRAMMAGMKTDPDLFLEALERNARQKNEALMERDETGHAIVSFMAGKTEWKGQIEELARELWPRTSRQKRLSAVQLGLYLRRMQINLESQGIGIEMTRSHGIRTIELKQMASFTPSTRHPWQLS